VCKWFGDRLVERESFLQQIDQLPQLKPVLRIPLLATLVLGVYGSTDTLPQSRVALYEMFVSLLAGGWDIAKKVQRETQFGPEPKITVLIRLAGILQLASKRDANLADFRAAILNTLPGIKDKSERMLQELVHDGFLVRTGDTYAFCHLSFQEFLAAKDLFDSKGRKAKAALVKFLEGDAWWRDVITFYAALSNNPKEMETFIHENAIEVDAKSNDDSSRHRASYLLEDLMLSFPGAKPNFNISYKKSRQPRLAF
jgi:predicted NACHT family NTPase